MGRICGEAVLRDEGVGGGGWKGVGIWVWVVDSWRVATLHIEKRQGCTWVRCIMSTFTNLDTSFSSNLLSFKFNY